jgi:tetratricopeptide (TPR) repeat protein
VGHLDEALRRNPKHYWSAFQRGMCHQELGEPMLAVADFSRCVGLWPEFAWGHYNRGYVLHKAGRDAEAAADFTAALERDAGFREAWWNRAHARLALGQYGAALEDMERTEALGRDDAALHVERGLALEKLGRAEEADDAFEAAFARLAGLPPEVQANVRLRYGMAVAAREQDEAGAAFDEVLAQEAVSAATRARAHYGRAMVAEARGKLEEAVGALRQAARLDEGMVEARRYRAVLLARLGRFAEAMPELTWCLEREPQGGPTLYAAACVTALAARKFAGQPGTAETARQSLDFLRQAFARGYGRQQAPTDPDLAGVRDDPVFQKALRSVP